MSVTTELLAVIPSPPRGLSLWEVDEQLQLLMETAQEEEAEHGEVSLATMQALQTYFQAAVEKVDRIAGFLKLEKVLEPAYKAEKQRLEQRWRGYQNHFDRCKLMLLEFLRARNETKIKGATNTISRQNNSMATLTIEDPEKVPETYRRMTLTITTSLWKYMMNSYKDAPDSMIELRRFFAGMTEVGAQPFVDEKAVRAALHEGLEVNGAELKFGEHIRVR